MTEILQPTARLSVTRLPKGIPGPLQPSQEAALSRGDSLVLVLDSSSVLPTETCHPDPRPRFLSPHQSWSSEQTMSSIPQSPTSTISRPGSRDTGFPEPFNGDRNTTLPHPEANLSPDACITAEDISVNKVLNRSRRSFLSKNSRRAVSHGKITPAAVQMYSDAVLLESEGESPPFEKHDPLLDRIITKDDSIGRTSSSLNGDDYPPSAKQVRNSNDSPSSPTASTKRRSMLSRLRISSR